MRTINQVKEDLRRLGYGEMASMLVPDNEYITSIVWQKEDIRWMIKQEDEEPTEELVEHIYQNMDIFPLEDAQYGNEYISSEVYSVLSEKN